MESREDPREFEADSGLWTILVVEDEVLVRMLISDYLQECGFKVLEAGSAVEAIAILEFNIARIDLLFTDIKLPGQIDGVGLAHWVRTNRPRLPIVLTSGEAKETDTAKSVLKSAPFFPKPYDVHQVVARIRDFIEHKKLH